MLEEIIDGRYRLLRVLGQGGMGAVYEAEHTGTGRRVAIKLILGADLATDPHTVQRFQREARAAGSIETQHVVQVLDTGTDPASARPYLVMELLHGEDLRHALRRCSALPAIVALRVIGQACVGLLRAHEAGVIHRDIKPANLFLSRRDDGEIVVKVVDFGIAKLTVGEALTATGEVFGSPQYMSPEQVKGGKLVDHRTDIWSIGIVLYELLAGRRPHAHRDNLGAMLLSLCTEPAPPIQDVAPWVPAEIARFVHGALTLDMNARYESMSVMLEALRRLVPDGLSLRADMLVPLTAEQRAHVTPRAPSIPGASPEVEVIAEVKETSTVRKPRHTIDTTTTVPFNLPRSAQRPTSTRAPMLATLGVLGAIGAAGAYKLARSGDDHTPRDALVVSAWTTSAPDGPLPASAPSEPAPAPTPAERSVRLAIEPANATVAVDDREVPVTDGSVEVRGVLGSSHRVRVRQEKNETVQEVVIGESGPVPSKIQLGAPLTRDQPSSPGPHAGSPGTPVPRQPPPVATASPAASPPPAPPAAPPPVATATPVEKPAAKPANTGVSRKFDD